MKMESEQRALHEEFLELKQGAMTMTEYVAKFTELACFVDDYMATDMVKVRKFEGGLKLSIRGKIMGLLLQNFDLIVEITMAIKRKVDDARNIYEMGAKCKKKEGQFFPSSSGKRQRTFTP